MYLSRIRYAIALVLLLTQEFNLMCAADLTFEPRTPTAVVTNFFKAPWINLNSSWRNEVTTQCKNDVTTLFESADAGEMWALQMLDAASRIPSGILMGNIVDLGQYDQCIGVKGHDNPANIQGQHCMVSVSLPHKFVRNASAVLYIQRLSLVNPTVDVDPSLTLSVCLPSSCSDDDVLRFANASIHSTPELVEFQVSIARVVCSGVESADDLPMGTYLTISFFAVIGSILVFCTACDLVVRTRPEKISLTLETLAKFSLYTNAIKLLSTERNPGTMPAIYGIRFLSTSLIITHHRGFLTLLYPMVNLSDFYEYRESVLASLNFMLLYTVDTFFIISGFLVTYSFLRKMRSGIKYNMMEFYIHRYIRITPCVGTLLLFIIFIVPHLGSGPIWRILLGNAIGYCRKNWWANLLFIQNFANREEMCIPHTWHLAVEMQFFLLSPIILYPLYHRPRLGLMILGGLSIAAMITPAIQILVNNYSFLFSSAKIRAESVIDFYNTYTITYNRALPYLIGIFLGYDVVNNKRRVTEAQAVFNWILTCILILFCFWNCYYIQPNAIVYDAISEAVYVSLGRFGWSLAMAWILYACTQGYGGPVTWFLSLPVFTSLSRMAYGMYLVHLVIQVGMNAMKRTAEYYTPFSVLHLVWGDLVMCIALAFILNVCIETPAIILEEVVRAEGRTVIIKRTSTTVRKELPAVIDEYLHLIKDQICSDLDIGMRMQRLDFWRTISNILNTLCKGPAKSSGEWVKTWREWKKHTQQVAHIEDIQNNGAQSQTKVPTLEQELLIFLIAVSRGLNNAASYEESDIADSASRFQLGSYDFDNEDLVEPFISDTVTFTKKTT